MIALNFLVAFNLGLVSTLHCWGMCGPIIAAYSLGLPDRRPSAAYVTLFNAGRVSSYIVAGLLCGLLGSGIADLIQAFHGQQILQGLAALILILIGLYIAGWLPQLSRIETTGMLLWKHLQPLTGRLLPIDSTAKAYASGLIWGWLPCGLVYSVLLWNLANADALTSALNMLAFGLGTLPGMITAGLTASTTLRWLKKTHLRRLMGVIVILAGLFSVWITLSAGDHHQHAHPRATQAPDHEHSHHHHP